MCTCESLSVWTLPALRSFVSVAFYLLLVCILILVFVLLLRLFPFLFCFVFPLWALAFFPLSFSCVSSFFRICPFLSVSLACSLCLFNIIGFFCLFLFQIYLLINWGFLFKTFTSIWESQMIYNSVSSKSRFFSAQFTLRCHLVSLKTFIIITKVKLQSWPMVYT